jgi:hypothetical protein
VIEVTLLNIVVAAWINGQRVMERLPAEFGVTDDHKKCELVASKLRARANIINRKNPKAGVTVMCVPALTRGA